MIKRLLPLSIFFSLIGLYYYFGMNQYLSWEVLQEKNETLKEIAFHHFFWTSFIFILSYATYTMLCLPGIFILSILAGYLFEQPVSTMYVTLAATIGSTFLFLATRTAVGDLLRKKASPFLISIENLLIKNETLYLFLIRLFPLFPLSLVTISCAFFKIRFRSFLWTTFLGAMPIIFLYTQIGSGLTTVLNQNEPLSLETLLIPKITLSVVGLASFCVLPFFIKQFKA